MRWAATTAALLVLAAIVAGIAMFSRYRARSTLAAPEKSIAVLPFENLSEDKDERLLCRRHPGRDSDALIEDRRSEGDLAYIHAALQKRAGKLA